MEDAVELQVVSPPAGRGPVTAGVPWPRGRLAGPQRLALTDARGRHVPLQTRALDLWPDGSVRWVLLDWIAEAGAGPYRVAVAEPVAVARAVVPKGVAEGEAMHFSVRDAQGRECRSINRHLEVEEPGPVRYAVCVRGRLQAPGSADTFAEYDIRFHYYVGSSSVRIELTVRNPRRALHPGGLWDLGDPGSIYMKDVSLTFALPGVGAARVACSAEPGAPAEEFAPPFELYQDSSGGANWRSTNHMNRGRAVPLTFRGYRLRAGGGERTGLRATPIVTLTRGAQAVGVAVPQFWQNFPMAIEATDEALTLRLLPQQFADLHELQGGEQKTWTFGVAFGPDATPEPGAERAETPFDLLEWYRSPAHAVAPPKWYCESGAIPYLTPRADDPNTEYLKLVDAAIEGPDTFDAKREKIDEYGWRHFGDIYGDHEAVYATHPPGPREAPLTGPATDRDGPREAPLAGPATHPPGPLVSHYNNQYDAIAGFGYQFLRSGDLTWQRHMSELAAHVIDIDIYHTTQDKSAYNGGLFWHTYHYADADTGTHRSYPRALLRMTGMPGLDPNSEKAQRSKHVYAAGGGPANEHNYTTGLMLHHFLTGNAAAREAALGLARWVIDLDDGTKTVFRFLSRADTGHASQSRDPGYHGPGRGSGNSLSALLDGHRLSGDGAFLAKAERLIRRCVHPADDVPRRNLLDVENRWFYTMFLQALGKYLDHKAERGQIDSMYAYARAALLHYARWMAAHEVPTLSRPEVLEYPNETWAAQDMRKSEVFKFAAKHATGPERTRFLARAEFFFRDAVARLAAFPTRTLARPVVLMLSYGYMHAHFQAHPDEAAPPPAAEGHDFGTPEVFVPQKVIAKKRAKLLAAAGAIGGAAALAALAAWLLL